MLELNTGEPRWYQLAVVCLVFVLLAALTFNRVQGEYALLVLLIAIIIVGMDYLARKRKSVFTTLRVDKDFSLKIRCASGDEFVAEKVGACWVSSRMIIIPLRLDSGLRINTVISRGRNDRDIFRRFSVICRFGFAVDDSERHNVA